MNASPAPAVTAKGAGPTSQDVLDLMHRTGAWYTRDEVAKALDAPQMLRDTPLPGSIDPLLSAVFSGQIFCLSVPDNEGIPFYHAVPSDYSQSRLAVVHFATVFDLSPSLMKKLVEKVDVLHKQGRLCRPAPPSMRVMILVNEHLASMGLLDANPRPVHGLQYPCNWQASDLSPASCGISTRKMVWVSFTGFIKNAPPLIPVTRKCPCGNPNHYDAYSFKTLWTESTVRQYPAVATLHLSEVAWYMVNAKTLSLVDTPPRQTIVWRTKQLLREAADHTETVVPFTPIRCKFRLLTEPPS